jgi:alkylation response protein AidB-like acyl-CoA dehydrogenase
MQYGLDNETLAKRDALIEFIRSELDDNVADREPGCEFSASNWKKCAEYGIHGLLVDPAYGGGGQDVFSSVAMMEALGYACRDNGLTFAILSQMLSIQPALEHFGSEQIKKNYLSRLVAGECGAFAITEENSGSDTYSLETTAKAVNGGYVLNGRKKFITLAPVAGIAVVFATVDPERGQWGVTGFVIDSNQEGFRATETQPKMGLRTTPIGDIILEDCFVPENQRLGKEGAGVGIFNKAMESERSYILAGQVGAMERQLEDSIQFARKRKQFGSPIAKFQSVANRIADMKLRLETSRLLLYKVAWLESQGMPLLLDAAIANLHLSESFVDSSLDAVRNHGARGYLSEFEVEREFRDSVGGLVYSGTSDIQRNIIARMLGL